MGDSRFLPGLVLVALCAAFALLVLLAAGLSWPGRRRAGLIAGVMPLALLPAVTAAAYGSWKLLRLFTELARDEASAAERLLEAMNALWAVQRVAWGAFAAVSVLGLALGLWRSDAEPDARPCSARRALVLALLSAAALVVAVSSTRPFARGLRVTAAVAATTHDDPTHADPAADARREAVLASEGLQSRGSGSIGAASRFISRAMTTSLFGGAVSAVVLLGLALPGLVLAANVRFGVGFTALAAVVWLLAATAAAAVAAGVLDPLHPA